MSKKEIVFDLYLKKIASMAQKTLTPPATRYLTDLLYSLIETFAFKSIVVLEHGKKKRITPSTIALLGNILFDDNVVEYMKRSGTKALHAFETHLSQSTATRKKVRSTLQSKSGGIPLSVSRVQHVFVHYLQLRSKTSDFEISKSSMVLLTSYLYYLLLEVLQTIKPAKIQVEDIKTALKSDAELFRSFACHTLFNPLS